MEEEGWGGTVDVQIVGPWITGKGSAHIHLFVSGVGDRGTGQVSAGWKGEGEVEEEGVTEGGLQQEGIWQGEKGIGRS